MPNRECLKNIRDWKISNHISKRDRFNDHRKQIINVTLDKENKIVYSILDEVSRVHDNR